jgi:isoquinoline 1-oxidoreductase
MGLGPALREAMEFENGEVLNASFGSYRVPRFSDVPQLDVHLLDRPEQPSAGGGETPIIAIAPAIANAVFHATGKRLRELPLRLPAT